VWWPSVAEPAAESEPGVVWQDVLGFVGRGVNKLMGWLNVATQPIVITTRPIEIDIVVEYDVYSAHGVGITGRIGRHAPGANMVARGTPCPKKLKKDAIIEAVFEIQFEVAPTLPEVFYGRLIDQPQWKLFQQLRLPAYEIPASMRVMNPSFRFAPVIQLVESNDQSQIVRMGPQVLSYHRRKYCGWGKFQPELDQMVDALFSTAPETTISRLGLRYMNAFSAAGHGIRSVAELDLSLKIADETISDFVNINYSRSVPPVGACMVRIATPDHVQGLIPEETTVFVDVDVYTKGGATFKDGKSVKEWVVQAHEIEKDEFFHLLTKEKIEELKEI
jgi:uncharacterized protein (TIGR04255 family)